MKKLVLATMVFGLIAVSCKKKAKDYTKANIVGKWKFESYRDDVNNNNLEDDQLITLPYTYVYYTTYNADGTLLYESSGYPDESGTWSLVGDSQLIEMQSGGYRDTVTIKKLIPPDMTVEQIDNSSTPNRTWIYYKKQ